MPRTSKTTAQIPLTAGLMAQGVPVPLEGVSVDATITGECARVTIAQRFRNCEAQPIEAVYVFPLDEGAAVCGFEAVSAGVHYVGEVKSRDEAFRIYDDAMQAGHSGYLLDEERADVFTASVGNLPPDAEVLIRLTYVAELAMDGPALRFTLPTTVSPRYAPHADRIGVGRSQEEVLNPSVAWHVPYGLNLTMALQMPARITRIESPSHPVSVTLDGARATVTLAQDSVALDRDVVVVVAADGLDTPHALVERDASGAVAGALVFQPSFAVEQAPSEVVFVVDRSGSMEGTSIAEVRNALQLCLRSLVAGSRFDIVGFGSTFTSLFGECRAYDETTLAEASRHTAGLDADLGGTEILPALKATLKRPRCGLPRQIVLLTDGQVSNTDEVLALVRKHAHDTRVFTFGIGAGASAHLVRGVARAGNGAAEMIAPGERTEPKVVRQFARVLAPALTDVKVDWGGLDVTASPTRPPAVFAGGRVVVYGWLRDVRPAVATLTAQGPDGPVSCTVSIDPEAAMPGSTVSTLAARARIRELEEAPEGIESRGSKQTARRDASVKDEVIRVATTYGLASRETSFVAVERRASPVEGEVVLRRIPVALTSGWGALDELTPLASRALTLGPDMVCDIAAPSMPFASRMRRAFAKVEAMRWPKISSAPARAMPSSGRSPGKADHARPGFRRTLESDALRQLDRLVALQHADGSWDLTRKLAATLGMPWDRLSIIPPDLSGVADAGRLWATLVALAWLARHAGDAQDEWVLLARKAERWVAAAGGTAKERRAWARAADALVSGITNS